MPVNPNADDRDHRLPLGARVRAGPGPRPSRSAGRSRRPGSTIASACSATGSGPPNICRSSRSTRFPCFKEGEVELFESGAILQYLGEKSETLLPRETQGKYRAIALDLCAR